MALETEIAIVGGGPIGLTAALSFAAMGQPTTLIDAMDPRAADFTKMDGRASSLAPTSVQLLKSLGLWDEIAADAQPMTDILVTDGRLSDGAAPLYLHFDGQKDAGGPLAHMIENRLLVSALARAVEASSLITLIAPAKVERADRTTNNVALHLSNGDIIETQLLIAADGGQSPMRKAMGFQVTKWAYGQRGIVSTVTHGEPHHGVAQEYFLPSGPFAILPLVDDEAGQHRASLVWTEKEAFAESLMALPDDLFAQELAKRFGSYLGEVKPIGPRFSYPLHFLQARDFAGPRVALLGDAAHVIHPLAGMGLNLGLRDAAALAECVNDAKALGLEFATGAPLKRYEEWRRMDATAMGVVTDGLNRLFSNDTPPLRLIRDVGLGLVDRIAPLKRALTKAATGEVGPVPKLMRP